MELVARFNVALQFADTGARPAGLLMTGIEIDNDNDDIGRIRARLAVAKQLVIIGWVKARRADFPRRQSSH